MYTPALDSKVATPEPRPTVIIVPRRGLLHLDLAAIWQHRVLLYFIVWRDLKIRYKQSVIGIGWVVLQSSAISPSSLRTGFLIRFLPTALFCPGPILQAHWVGAARASLATLTLFLKFIFRV